MLRQREDKTREGSKESRGEELRKLQKGTVERGLILSYLI